MAEAEIEEGKRRINFSPKTKEVLKAASGTRCCFNTCLRYTDGTALNERGELTARGLGVAAHIYSAGRKGPRGRSSMSADFIASAENGMWMCAGCGRLVDDFQDKYPAEYLLRMKAVRELAHVMEGHDTTIAQYINKVGIEDWNNCVWEEVEHIPLSEIRFVDTKAIKLRFCHFAHRKLFALDEGYRLLDKRLPPRFKQSAMAGAISSLGSSMNDRRPNDQVQQLFETSNKSKPSAYVQERARALSFAKAWAKEGHDFDISSRGKCIFAGSILLSAKNPENGVLTKPGLWLRAVTTAQVGYAQDTGELITLSAKASPGPVSPFGWSLSVKVQNGIADVHSQLTLGGLKKPYLDTAQERSEFWHMYSLVKKISTGWQAIGYLSLATQGAGIGISELLDPRAFDINCEIDQSHFAELLTLCEKVKAALEFEQRWKAHYGLGHSDHITVELNQCFFSNDLDLQLMLSAYDEMESLRDNQKMPVTYLETHPLKMLNERIGLCLRWNPQGRLLFTKVKTSQTLR